MSNQLVYFHVKPVEKTGAKFLVAWLRWRAGGFWMWDNSLGVTTFGAVLFAATLTVWTFISTEVLVVLFSAVLLSLCRFFLSNGLQIV